LKINRLHEEHGTEMAKLFITGPFLEFIFKLISLGSVNSPLVRDIHQTQVGEESSCPADREKTGILLSFEQSAEEMERPDENCGRALI
jgi:hypothetical protein